MKLNQNLFALLLSLSLIAACKKDNDKPKNQVPAANAGTSQAITLPTIRLH